jgi:iron complex outermembrane receptor protein
MTRYLSALLAGTALMSTPGVARASESSQADQTATLSSTTAGQAEGKAAAVAGENAGIADIVVTAQRRSESSQRAGIAISVLQPAALATVTSPQQLTALAPAVQISSAGGTQPIIYVRGVGTFAATPYADAAVAVNFDGTYLARPTSTSGLFYDLDRIEVLKGPQGTLYGRNATGGALNIIPTVPRIGERSMTASLSLGNYDAVNAQAAINLPIGENAAFRVAGLTYKHDGYNTDGTYSERGSGGRAQFLFKPSPDLSIRVAGDYFDLGGTGPTGNLIARDNLTTGRAEFLGLGPEVGLYDPRSIAVLNSTFVPASGNFYGAFPGPPFIDNQNYGVNTEVKANLGFADMTFVGGWRRGDVDNTLASGGFFISQRETDQQYSAELRLDGKVGTFDWLLGGYYFRDTIDSQYNINNNYLAANQSFQQATNSYAVFGRLNWNITDRLRLAGAVRQTWDRRKFDGIDNLAVGVCVSPAHFCPEIRRLPADASNLPATLASIGYIQPPGVPVYIDVLTGSQTSFYVPSQIRINDATTPSKTTYRVSAEFEPRDGSLLYASIETGYRVGGFSFSSLKPVFAPETITAYTVGSKNRFLDNRLQINVEGFVWRYEDQQISHQSLGATGGIEFVTENIGKSLNKGVELEIVAKPLSNTVLTADIQYLKARNKSFSFNEPDPSINAGFPAGTIPSVTNCPYTIASGTGNYRVDCSGLRALRSPKWTLNLGIQQTFDLAADYALIVNASTHYQSSSIVMFERRAFSVLNSYWMSDASVTLQFPQRQLSLTGFVSNIENKRVMGGSFYTNFSALTTGNFGPPRTYGARLALQF